MANRENQVKINGLFLKLMNGMSLVVLICLKWIIKSIDQRRKHLQQSRKKTNQLDTKCHPIIFKNVVDRWNSRKIKEF